jgi:hypothetical protein
MQRRNTMQRLLITVMLGMALTGCAGVTDWYIRTLYGADCRPEVVEAHGGTCVYLKDKKGTTDVQAAHP